MTPLKELATTEETFGRSLLPSVSTAARPGQAHEHMQRAYQGLSCACAADGKGHADVAVTCLAPLDEGHIRPSPADSAGGAMPQLPHLKPAASPLTRMLDAVAKSAKGALLRHTTCFALSPR
jgi:hypothetical protein